MTLSRRTYVKNYDHMDEDAKHIITVTQGGKPTAIKPERVSGIIEEAMYWRKANAIHQWFVDNCQEGEDDCKTYDVEEDQLKELLDLCEQVAADHSKAAELLPTQSGFFFGSTEYDEFYFKDIEDTIKVFKGLLAEDNSRACFEYHSSW